MSLSIVPPREGLRRAVAWLAEQGAWTPHLVEEACRRFDVSPADEEFLLREMHRQSTERTEKGSGSSEKPMP